METVTEYLGTNPRRGRMTSRVRMRPEARELPAGFLRKVNHKAQAAMREKMSEGRSTAAGVT